MVHPEVVGRGLSRCDNPACVQRADRAAARFVPRLNGAGTPQRGVRYRLQKLRDPRDPLA